MRRNIVSIDEEKCNGCGLCVSACAEGAIQLIDGKARLVSDVYCDGLGACLGKCPQDAISVDVREAVAFDEAAAVRHVQALAAREKAKSKMACGCPGTMAREIKRTHAAERAHSERVPSELTHWPVQLRLVSPMAPYLHEADLLLVADCVPFALADFHDRFLRGKPIVVGCPKLDDANYYVDKLAEIIRNNSLKSLTVVHMEVPCCSGLSRIAGMAREAAGSDVPVRDVTISINGEVANES